MSGVLHKVKNALQAEKNTPEAAAANQGNNGTVLAFPLIFLVSVIPSSTPATIKLD